MAMFGSTYCLHNNHNHDQYEYLIIIIIIIIIIMAVITVFNVADNLKLGRGISSVIYSLHTETNSK